MKKLYVLMTILLLSFLTLHSSTIRKMPLEQLHNWAKGYKVGKYTVQGANKKMSATRERKVAVNYQTRRAALIELRRRKDPKSIEVLSDVSTEGLSTRYSPKGKAGAGREGLSAVAQKNIRLLALSALFNFKGVDKKDEQKKIMKKAFRTVIMEGYAERNLALAVKNLGANKDILTNEEMDFYNEYFRRLAFRTIKNRKTKLLLAMFYTTEEFNRKSGIRFLNRALRGGLRGWLYRKAMKTRAKLISSGTK